MSAEKYEDLIQNYFDDNLTRDAEAQMFSVLSSVPEAREYFRRMHQLRRAVTGSMEEPSLETDTVILGVLNKPGRKTPGRIPVQVYTIAASVLLIVTVALFYLFAEVKESRAAITGLNRQVKEQTETIEMLSNSLPMVTVNSKITY